MQKKYPIKSIILTLIYLLSTPTFSSDNHLTLVIGEYKNTAGMTLPLMATSNTQGESWSFPKIPLPDVYKDRFFKVACNAEHCIAVGEKYLDFFFSTTLNQGKSWISDSFEKNATVADVQCNSRMCLVVGQSNLLPFLIIDNNKGSAWTHPKDIIEKIPPNKAVIFNSASCAEEFCGVAGGYITAENRTKPLIAVSSNQETTWSYPDINPPEHSGYSIGQLQTIHCKDETCIASGQYHLASQHIQGKPNALPLIAISVTKGNTWTFPNIPNTPFPLDHELRPEYYLRKVNCEGSFCLAVGTYSGIWTPPLLMISHDKGNSWSYPEEIIKKAPTDLRMEGFHDFSCQENFCMVVGWGEVAPFPITPGQKKPLIAITRDKGTTWSYVTLNLPKNANGIFEKISCKGDTCVIGARESYLKENGKEIPLLAVSHDRGLTWTYPLDMNPSVLPIDFSKGEFNGIN